VRYPADSNAARDSVGNRCAPVAGGRCAGSRRRSDDRLAVATVDRDSANVHSNLAAVPGGQGVRLHRAVGQLPAALREVAMGDSRARRQLRPLLLHHLQFQGNCQHPRCPGADRAVVLDGPPPPDQCLAGQAAAMACSRCLRLDDCPQAIELRPRRAKVDLRPLDADWVLKARGLRLEARPRRKAIATVVKHCPRMEGSSFHLHPRKDASSFHRLHRRDASNRLHPTVVSNLPLQRDARSFRLPRVRLLRHHVHRRARTRLHFQKRRRAPPPPSKSKEFVCAWRQRPFTRLISIRLMLG
jgi:hypothetical protein